MGRAPIARVGVRADVRSQAVASRRSADASIAAPQRASPTSERSTVDLSRIAAMRDVLAATGWVDRTRRFGRTLRGAGHRPGGLLVVGTPDEEPWHLAAHLDEEARYSGLEELTPTLVRWQPPAGAPAHLSIGLDRLERAGRGETVFVVAPGAAPEALLERVSDAKGDGATVLAVEGGDQELRDLAHEALTVPPDEPDEPGPATAPTPAGWPQPQYGTARTASGLVVPTGAGELMPAVSFDLVTHLVSVAAGEPDDARRRRMRDRLARMLDTLSGTHRD
jgi:hypothetical protein